MAAPKTTTLKDLSGTWTLNKTLSDSPEPVLSIQGISWMLRKTISMASMTLKVSQYTGPPPPSIDNPSPDASAAPVTRIDIDQVAAGLSGTSELRCLDNAFRSHEDWLFGKVKGQSRWIKAEEIDAATNGEGEFLTSGGWIEDDNEKAGPDGETHILNYVESEAGWDATQVWGFMNVNGERRYARNIVVKKGSKRSAIRFVYDFTQ